MEATSLDNYLQLINRLSDDDKLDLIALISKSLKSKRKSKSKSLAELFGALKDNATAEEWIERIQQSRTFTRQNESL